jgi:hypothetical protein
MKALNKKKREPRPEHRALADTIIGGLPRQGRLLFVTFRPPESECSGKLHEDFARFCAKHTDHFLVVLEYGPPPKDLDDLFEDDGHGEHVHAIVWVRNDEAFARAAHAWADRMKIHERARDWEFVTGWLRYRDHGRIRPCGKGRTKGYLRPNLIAILTYITKPSAHERDFAAHGTARGLFADGWERFCNATSLRASVTVPAFCAVCANPHEQRPTPDAGGRPRVFCGGTCRQRANRHEHLRDPHRRYRLISRRTGVRLVRLPGRTNSRATTGP